MEAGGGDTQDPRYTLMHMDYVRSGGNIADLGAGNGTAGMNHETLLGSLVQASGAKQRNYMLTGMAMDSKVEGNNDHVERRIQGSNDVQVVGNSQDERVGA